MKLCILQCIRFYLRQLFMMALLFMPYGVIAHQPVLNEFESTQSNPYVIENPEISKAIFSSLRGSPHFYQITSPEQFRFYAGITSPKIDNCDYYQHFSFSVFDENMKLIADFSDETYEWWPWYEEYGKKWYWIGPEFGENFKSTTRFEAGTYYIKVYNENQSGNYVLAVGDDEKFTAMVILKLLFKLPKINKRFWGEVDCETIMSGDNAYIGKTADD